MRASASDSAEVSPRFLPNHFPWYIILPGWSAAREIYGRSACQWEMTYGLEAWAANCSLLSGLAFAFLTWLMIGDHAGPQPVGKGFEWLGEAIMILLLPGFAAGFALSNNIHIADTWIVASANFLFYFGLVYLGATLWQKRRARG